MAGIEDIRLASANDPMDDKNQIALQLFGKPLDQLNEDEIIELSAGEMYVVAKGVMHKPSAENECQVMLVEPRGVVNTGDVQSELTASNDVWI